MIGLETIKTNIINMMEPLLIHMQERYEICSFLYVHYIPKSLAPLPLHTDELN